MQFHERMVKGMRYDLQKIMTKAWEIFRKNAVTFAEALHRAWLSAKAGPVNAERIARAKAAAGITEETATWKAWKDADYEVVHGSKALFSVSLIWGARGDGAHYTASFFGASQVQALA